MENGPKALTNGYNAMLHQMLICFCLSEAKCLCLNHCAWLLDDFEFHIQFVCDANKQKFILLFISLLFLLNKCFIKH